MVITKNLLLSMDYQVGSIKTVHSGFLIQNGWLDPFRPGEVITEEYLRPKQVFVQTMLPLQIGDIMMAVRGSISNHQAYQLHAHKPKVRIINFEILLKHLLNKYRYLINYYNVELLALSN